MHQLLVGLFYGRPSMWRDGPRPGQLALEGVAARIPKVRDRIDDQHAVRGRVELAHGVEYLRDRLRVQNVEVERLGMDGALGDLLAVEGGAVFGVAEGDAFARMARQALGDKESGKSFPAAGGTIKGHFESGFEGNWFLEGCHEKFLSWVGWCLEKP